MEKEDEGIILLFFQSKAGSSGLDGRNELWDHLNQNLMVSKMVFVALAVFVLWNFVLQGMHSIQFTGLCVFSACILYNWCGFKG